MDECQALDVGIARIKFENGEEIGPDFIEYTTALKTAREHEREARKLHEEAHAFSEYVTAMLTYSNIEHTEESPNPIIVELLANAQEKQQKAIAEVF